MGDEPNRTGAPRPPYTSRRTLLRRLLRWLHELVYTVGLIVGFNAPAPAQESEEGTALPPARGESRFATEVLHLLASADSVELETRGTPAASPHRARIRPVVDEDGRVYARPQGGKDEYWYRRIRINPGVTLHIAHETVHAHAVPIPDPRIATRVSELYRRRYDAADPDIAPLLSGDGEAVTVRLRPLGY